MWAGTEASDSHPQIGDMFVASKPFNTAAVCGNMCYWRVHFRRFHLGVSVCEQMMVTWFLGWGGGGHMRVLSRVEKKQSLLQLQKTAPKTFCPTAVQRCVLQEQQVSPPCSRTAGLSGKGWKILAQKEHQHAPALVTCSATKKPRKTVPDVGRESLAEVDVPEAIGELEGAAESEVALPPRRSQRDRIRRGSCGAGRKHSATF